MHRQRQSAATAAVGRQSDVATQFGVCLQAFTIVLLAAMLLGACQPTVRVEAPKDPITINLNIQADVRVTLEEKAKEDIAANPGVF